MLKNANIFQCYRENSRLWHEYCRMTKLFWLSKRTADSLGKVLYQSCSAAYTQLTLFISFSCMSNSQELNYRHFFKCNHLSIVSPRPYSWIYCFTDLGRCATLLKTEFPARQLFSGHFPAVVAEELGYQAECKRER